MNLLKSFTSRKKVITFVVTFNTLSNLKRDGMIYIAWKKGINEFGSTTQVFVKNGVAIWEQEITIRSHLQNQDGSVEKRNLTLTIHDVRRFLESLMHRFQRKGPSLDRQHWLP
jgi:hypothetical protein